MQGIDAQLRAGHGHASIPGNDQTRGGRAGGSAQLFRLLDEQIGGSLERSDLCRCYGAYIIRYQFLAGLADFFIASRILTANCEEFFKPTLAVTGMESFIGPIEIHVMLT